MRREREVSPQDLKFGSNLRCLAGTYRRDYSIFKTQSVPYGDGREQYRAPVDEARSVVAG